MVDNYQDSPKPENKANRILPPANRAMKFVELICFHSESSNTLGGNKKIRVPFLLEEVKELHSEEDLSVMYTCM